jgi:cytochrome c oxidase accessory protein FixG
MIDNDTLVISYDRKRGDPRGARRRRDNPAELGLGECIDCQLCVQVCPTGIDIRNGLQYQCIGCAACIDVCNDIMDKMKYPRGLIRYTTENLLHSGKAYLLRPRVIIYALILCFATAFLIHGFATRSSIELDISRDRNVLYRELANGDIENHFNLKILNKDRTQHQYRLSVDGLEGANIKIDDGPLIVAAATVNTFQLRITADANSLRSSVNTINLSLQALDDTSIYYVSEARFVGP